MRQLRLTSCLITAYLFFVVTVPCVWGCIDTHSDPPGQVCGEVSTGEASDLHHMLHIPVLPEASLFAAAPHCLVIRIETSLQSSPPPLLCTDLRFARPPPY
jgi:hypothetical protein